MRRPERSHHGLAEIAGQILRASQNVISNETALVSSGLLDSFSLLDVLHKLEQLAELRIPPGRVKTADLDTVDRMFELAVRVGKAAG